MGADPVRAIPIAELPEHPIAVSLPPDKRPRHPVDPSRAAEKYIAYLCVNVYHLALKSSSSST